MRSDYAVVDLSQELDPAGTGDKLRIVPSLVGPQHYTTYVITMMNHTGTHAEASSHVVAGGKDVAGLPVESFLGEGVALHLTGSYPGNALHAGDLECCHADIRPGDIVTIGYSSAPLTEPLMLLADAAHWLVSKGVKLVGVDYRIGLDLTGELVAHRAFLERDIPVIENLYNLDQVPGRAFFIGLPLKIKGLDSSPVRFVALVER